MPLALMLAVFVCLPGAGIVLGDPAPPLHIAEWVKGGPVNLAEGTGKSIYVIEFWGTYCIPCHEIIPLLSELQEEYRERDVIIVGVSSEDIAEVSTYMSEKGKAVGYLIAVDDQEKTWQAYMDAFGRETIPQAFIVDKAGCVAWEGHPSRGLKEALEQVVAGEYNVEAAREAYLARRTVPAWHAQYLRRIRGGAGEDKQELDTLGEKIVKYCADPTQLDQLAWHIATAEDVQYRNLKLAARASAKALELTGGKDAMVLETHGRVLFEMGQVAEAVECQKRAIAHADGGRQRRAYKKKLREYEKAL